MTILNSGRSPKQEKKVANKLYQSIVIAVVVIALSLIVIGTLNQDNMIPNSPQPEIQQETPPLQPLPETPVAQ